MKNLRRSLPVLMLLAFALVVSSLFHPAIGAAVVGIGALAQFAPDWEIGTLGLNYTNNIAARDTLRKSKEVLFAAMYDKFVSKYGPDRAADECMAWVNNRKWSQSEIRLEVELNATSTNFLFGVTTNDQNSTGVIFPTENRLDMQDTLIVSEHAVFLANPASRTDVNFNLFSYANTQAFAAADIAGLTNTFFKNGSLYCTADKDVIIPYRGLIAHYNANETQQTAALGAGSPQDEVHSSEDGFITDEPNWYVIGTKGYKPSIVLKNALPSVTNSFTRAVLILRGNLAQNSTNMN